MLAGEPGITLVNAIAQQIHERASEWRAMPRLPRSASHVGTDLLAATQSDGEAADNLRKTDSLTMRRAGFAIKLRDFEAYERDLLPDAWWAHRQAFFRAFVQHVLVLPQFFDLAVYLPRVIRLPKEMVAQRGIPARKTVAACVHAAALLPDTVLDGTRHLAQWIRFKGLPHGLLFATRPYNLPELFILNKAAYDVAQRETMQAVVLAVRGFTLGDAAPAVDKHGVLQIPYGQPQRCYGIAVSSWKTQMASWTASVMRFPDPDVERYARLCRLLDVVIAQPQHSRYLVLPELALPALWFIRIARKLQGRGISLITGIEYLHASKGRVRHQVWAALSHDGLGFPSLVIYRQDKQRPAFHEEQELQRLAGLELKPEKVWKTPPILQHGDLRFALLVCSELTNISHRAALRGKPYRQRPTWCAFASARIPASSSFDMDLTQSPAAWHGSSLKPADTSGRRAMSPGSKRMQAERCPVP